ncbi:MAG: N-formylglutamate amidohydrolase [Burkholderiaceae bacterium]
MLDILRPDADRWLPLVLDSPHSGSQYPSDFGFSIDHQVLRRSEDAFVDELFAPVTRLGGTFVHARFPRCYIDPNRADTDIDLTMIAGQWPHPVKPSGKIARGSGLIWKQVKQYGAIYDRLLSCEEVQARIEQCWAPYHQAVSQILHEAHERAGVVIHLNCHSMASSGDNTTEDGSVRRADFVLGNLDGASCDDEVLQVVASTLQSFGYQVAINDPYKGQELIRRYSDPNDGKHSLQIEINRALYMDEQQIKKTAGFKQLQEHLFQVSSALASLASARRRPETL